MPFTRTQKLFAITTVSLALSAGLGVMGWRILQPGASEQLTLLPSELHEVCFDIAPPIKLEYDFQTSHPVQFNLHYHDEDNVLFPVPEQLTRTEQATFTPESEQVYCLMWTNTGNENIELSLTYRHY